MVRRFADGAQPRTRETERVDYPTQIGGVLATSKRQALADRDDVFRAHMEARELVPLGPA